MEKNKERSEDAPVKKRRRSRSGKCVDLAKLDIGKLIALTGAGWSAEMIADEMGISRAVVIRCWKKIEERRMAHAAARANQDHTA